jgi:hypothetical protein
MRRTTDTRRGFPTDSRGCGLTRRRSYDVIVVYGAGARALIGVAAAVAGIIGVAGCGSSTPAPTPVRLTVQAPADNSTTLVGEVLITGTVVPDTASVLVAGRPVPVSAGSFSTRIPVRPGVNIVDVLAGAARAPGAMTAVRVYREVPVAVPQLSGDSPSDAVAALRALGLTPTVQQASGLFESLIPVSSQVCSTDPPAGQSVPPGTAVAVQVGKLC